ncbi:GNAT family N-acetyltransferase [Ktedonobacteria bacterium brp13]|nr:GNAT family N-acetyltransferase [Ktedonobacteria bacterium brp13]
MITCIRLKDLNTIQQLRDDYLRTLVAPADGWWEGAIIAHSTFWMIQDEEQFAGYYCVDADNYLLRFYLLERYQHRAQDIFRWVIATNDIQYAIAGTIEPLYLSLCLDLQVSSTPHVYLFHDHKHIEPPSNLGISSFRKAEERELNEIMRFYQANIEGAGEELEAFLRKRLKRAELFVGYAQQTLITTGECIPSQKQTPYTDLGMVVARSYRGRGVGSFTLMQLKKHCYAAGWKPICSCSVDNHASKKAIEKAGFISEHKMVKITFSSSTTIETIQ